MLRMEIPKRVLRIPLAKSVQVLNYDTNLIVALDKPVGILSQPNKSKNSSSKKKERSIIDGGYDEDKEFYKYFCLDDNGVKTMEKFWLLNRLDSATSGVILGTCDEKIATIVKKLFKEREIDKTYYARVFGKLKNLSSEVWENKLSIVKANTIKAVGSSSSLFDSRYAKLARTTVRLVDYNQRTNTSLIELHPLTGFSHQLRFQCAEHGHPIVGDKVYGDFDSNKVYQELMKATIQTEDPTSLKKKFNIKRLMLHSHRMQFDYIDVDNRVNRFSSISQLPVEFEV